MMQPSQAVSVIMPVYNGEEYLHESLQSICDQSLSDFEFVIVNDASTDTSRVILEEFARSDARVRLYHNENNMGLPATLNRCLEIAQGDYIARMDQDDISLPNRLEKQIEFMNAHPEVGICGTWVKLIGDKIGDVWRHPVDHDAIYARMLFNNALAHPTVMMRVSSLQEHNLFYDETSLNIEDYDLWSRALQIIKVANVGEILLNYRVHVQSSSVKYRAGQVQAQEAIYRRLLQSLQIQPSPRELELHQKIANVQYESGVSFLYNSYVWLKKISRANRRLQIIDPAAVDLELNMRWREVCDHIFFRPIESPPLFLHGFSFPLGKIKKLVYKLLSLLRVGAN